MVDFRFGWLGELFKVWSSISSFKFERFSGLGWFKIRSLLAQRSKVSPESNSLLAFGWGTCRREFCAPFLGLRGFFGCGVVDGDGKVKGRVRWLVSVMAEGVGVPELAWPQMGRVARVSARWEG